MPEPLWVLGTSGLAREMAQLVRVLDPARSRFGPVRFADEQAEEQLVTRAAACVLGVGYPSVRRKITERLASASWPVLVHPRATVGDSTTLGAGTVVTAGVVTTTDTVIGDFTLLNYNATVGHDVTVGRWCVVNPLASVAGGVVLEDEVLVGTGANVLQGVRVGQGAVVGAGAVVTSDVPAGTTVVGIPARALPDMSMAVAAVSPADAAAGGTRA